MRPVSAANARAHPRSRGENCTDRAPDAASAGSSPLTRGKRCAGPAGSRPCRLIPAHAGKTPSQLGRQRPRTAHPRSRGENRGRDHQRRDRVGSSPLTRGKRSGRVSLFRKIRLIPAHAGKTRTASLQLGSNQAHPRSRGENGMVTVRRARRVGSSPLTRGKRCPTRPSRGGSRLIPAHAGKTIRSGSWSFLLRAHPRSRGENASDNSVASPRDGSSPLTRGKPPKGAPSSDAGGLIPAHAGKTRSRAASARRSAAHPRSRGENIRA